MRVPEHKHLAPNYPSFLTLDICTPVLDISTRVNPECVYTPNHNHEGQTMTRTHFAYTYTPYTRDDVPDDEYVFEFDVVEANPFETDDPETAYRAYLAERFAA
jgi:hypothetical protein